MRILLGRVVPGLLLAALLGSPAWAQPRVATVDMRKLFEDYYKTKEARAVLDGEATDMAKEHAKMVEDWKKQKEDYQTALASANDQGVSAGERERGKKLAEDKLKQIKKTEAALAEYERSAQSTYKDQTDRVRGKVVEEIRAVLEAKARAAGYTLVFDASAIGPNGVPVFLCYHSTDDDLTQAVLEELNAPAPREPAKAPEKRPEKKADKKKP
ncbi:MAG TPA: OmpH family outer membrane protein [Dongiaceae bacterium]|nr:OmpH family outer membrane protein [Dongiaceae bacterium]